MIRITWLRVMLERFIKNRGCVSNEPYSSFDNESTGQQVAPTEIQTTSTENLRRCTRVKREVHKARHHTWHGGKNGHFNMDQSSYTGKHSLKLWVWNLTETLPWSHFKTCGFIMYQWMVSYFGTWKEAKTFQVLKMQHVVHLHWAWHMKTKLLTEEKPGIYVCYFSTFYSSIKFLIELMCFWRKVTYQFPHIHHIKDCFIRTPKHFSWSFAGFNSMLSASLLFVDVHVCEVVWVSLSSWN